MKKYVTEHIKTKELHKTFGCIINETTFEEDTSLTKISESIGKGLYHQIQIILSLQLHQLHLLKYLKKVLNHQTNVLNHQKQQLKVNKLPQKTTKQKRKNNIEEDTNVDDETDIHLLIIKIKTSNDKNNKLSTRKRKKVETKSNQIVKKVDVIESSSKSQNIQFDESIKSPIIIKRKLSTHQNNFKQKR